MLTAARATRGAGQGRFDKLARLLVPVTQDGNRVAASLITVPDTTAVDANVGSGRTQSPAMSTSRQAPDVSLSRVSPEV